MSLDQNLFTLAIAASTEETGALDLTDPNSSTIHYRKRQIPPTPEAPYNWGLYDPLSGSLLCTVTAPNAANKQKWIELHNPDVKVELAFVGKINFKWDFDWEGHTFEWRKESCYLLRKPDPPVQVAVTREPAGRIKTTQVQLLDYNLNRFDIDDRKGLEIVMLAAMLTFQDHSDALKAAAAGNGNAASQPPSRHNSDAPQTPAKSPSDIVSSLQFMNKADRNDVIVGEEGTIEDYANHCVQMLKDRSMIYIILRPHSQEHVSKVVQVAEATKRFHYKSGGHDEELFQYVTMEDAKPEKSGPKVINLDDGNKKKKEKEYKPPQTLTVHLSKIPMPELQPKARPSAKPSPTPATSSESSSSFLPWKKGGRTPSPSRPAASTSQSPPPNAHHNHLTKPQPPQQPQQHQQHQQHQPPNPYRYQMALYPPTGPPPSFPERKDHKEKKNRPQQQQQPSNQSMQIPGAYPYGPGPSGSGAMNYNQPEPGQNKFAPPPGPPPPVQPPNQAPQLHTVVTNGIASVGYSLFDKVYNNKAGSTSAKQ